VASKTRNIRRFLALSIAGALTACASVPPTTAPVPTSAPGDLHFQAREVFYDLAGPSAADIARQLDEHSRRNDGRLAETRWKLTTQLRFGGPEGGPCSVSKMDVNVDIEIELPRWKGAAQSPVRERWEKFQAAARVHEKGHYDHAILAGNEVASALRGLEAGTCDELSTLSSARTNAIVAKYTRIDEKYDAETRHGILQGTVWEFEPGR
jgi:predicted secreted Zn-dependent protease